MGRSALVLVVAVVCGGCFVDVDFGNTRFSCERDGTCPGGYTCVDGACVLAGAGGSDAGDGADAAPQSDGAAGDDQDATPVVACGVVEIEVALGDSMTGTTVGGGQELGASCIESAGAEVVHRLVVEGDAVPVTLQATTELPGTGYDAVLYVRRACDVPDSELACSDSGVGGGDTVTFTAEEAGVYYVVVDSHAGGSGSYELQLTVVD